MVSSQALLFLRKRIKQADFSVEATLRNPHFYNCSARIVGMDGLSNHSIHSPTPTNQPTTTTRCRYNFPRLSLFWHSGRWQWQQAAVGLEMISNKICSGGSRRNSIFTLLAEHTFIKGVSKTALDGASIHEG